MPLLNTPGPYSNFLIFCLLVWHYPRYTYIIKFLIFSLFLQNDKGGALIRIAIYFNFFPTYTSCIQNYSFDRYDSEKWNLLLHVHLHVSFLYFSFKQKTNYLTQGSHFTLNYRVHALQMVDPLLNFRGEISRAHTFGVIC